MTRFLAQAIDMDSIDPTIFRYDFGRVSITEKFFETFYSPTILLIPEAFLILLFLFFFINYLTRPVFFYSTSCVLILIGTILYINFAVISSAYAFYGRIFLIIILHAFSTSIIGYALGFIRYMIFRKDLIDIKKPNYRYLIFLIVGLIAALLLGLNLEIASDLF